MPLLRGIRPIPVPTMLPIGLVNAYLLEGEPLTLIDAGPATEDAHDALRRGLRDAGHSMDDLELILLTHGHVDHAGLAGAVREDSGAKLLVPENDRPVVEKFQETFATRRKRYCDELSQAGAPEGTCELVSEYMDWVRSLGAPATVDGILREGDVVRAGGTELRVLHTPGHSAGSSCYLTPEGELFCGDTMIKDLTPNAAFGGADGVSLGLADHLATLRRLRGLALSDILPGHRESFRDVRAYVAGHEAKFRARQDEILRLLGTGPQSPLDLIGGVFGTLPIHEILLGLTEVLGHLEVLAAEGIVSEEEREGRRVFSLALARP